MITEKERKEINDFCAGIAALRKKLGVSQLKLAERCGMKAHHMSNIENAKHVPSLSTLLKIAAALDVKLSFRKKRKDDMSTK